MGRRLTGAAVAGVLVFGGGVAVAAPASAAPVVRTAPDRAPQVRDGARVHRISQVAGSKSKSASTSASKSKLKKKAKHGFFHGFFHGLLGWLAALLLVGVLATVLIVLWVRRSRSQAG
ncbi:hypothetical protein AB0D10_38700 [Kitasatospora sp. NPDC048545]|uniref:hypothetical protein n=1 Tax=Kitasatospora sp. NPDC048545 TaxID=3157208 RepID=UPI0033C22B35